MTAHHEPRKETDEVIRLWIILAAFIGAAILVSYDVGKRTADRWYAAQVQRASLFCTTLDGVNEVPTACPTQVVGIPCEGPGNCVLGIKSGEKVWFRNPKHGHAHVDGTRKLDFWLSPLAEVNPKGE
jgi:hypothetical protein